MTMEGEYQFYKEAHDAFERTGTGKQISGKKGLSKTSKIGFQMGMSGTHNTVMAIGQKENPGEYSETAQEIKMRKAAEKRARKSGKALQ